MRIRFMTLGLLLLLVMPFCASAAADDPAAPDSNGRAPGARSIYCATPPSTFTLYAFAPELLAGWNTPLRDYEKKFMEKTKAYPWLRQGYSIYDKKLAKLQEQYFWSEQKP